MRSRVSSSRAAVAFPTPWTRQCFDARRLEDQPVSAVFLSIIIPAYNEESRLPKTLRSIDDYLGRQSYTAEVLVVENGSDDATLAVASEFAASHPYVRVLQAARGKGSAVRRGMIEAVGQYRFFCDADLAMPIENLANFLPPRLNDFDVAIGSREIKNAVRYGEPVHRHLIGRVFNRFVRLLILRDLEDTQCGFKCFRAEAAEDLFTHQRLNGFSFDVEVLFIARRRGYRIREVATNCHYDGESRVRFFRDTIRMLLDILSIRTSWRRGLYDENPSKAGNTSRKSKRGK